MISVESIGTTLDPLGSTPIRVLGPQFGETVYISNVNGTRKVKSNAQVTTNKNSRLRAEFFYLSGCWEDSAPTQIFPNFWNCPKLVELGSSRLQVNIDKANSRRYDVTRYMVYREPSKDLQSAHQCSYRVYIVRSQVQAQISSVELS